MDWLDEILEWLDGRLQVVIGLAVFMWVISRMAAKRKKAKDGMPAGPAPAAGVDQAATSLDWDGTDSDVEPETSVPMADGYAVTGPTHHTIPNQLPYREEGVKSGCLIFAIIIFGAAAAVYYFFEQDINDLWRELMETLGWHEEVEPLRPKKDF